MAIVTTVEPGVRALVFELAEAVGKVSATVSCRNHDYTGAVEATADGSQQVVVVFVPGLPDASLIKPHHQEPVSVGNCVYDYNTDGVITTADYSLIKPLYQHSAPACP